MAQTISMSKGRIAIQHDIRNIITPNIDTSLSGRNAILRDELKDFNYDLEKYTDAYFQPYLDEYNAKQRREDRKKIMPYTHYVKQENLKREAKNIENKALGLNKQKICGTQIGYEFVLQHGNHDTNPTIGCDPKKEREYFEQTIKKIEEKYPHCKILLATMHLDEPNGTPHCHILVQFVGEKYKQGISHQLSVCKALELDGLKRADSRSEGYQMERMTEDIKDNVMTPLLKDIYNEERDIIGEDRGNMPLPLFRKKTKEEYAVLQAKEAEMNRMESDFKAIENDYITTVNELAYLESEFDDLSHKNEILDKNIAEKENALKTAYTRLQALKNDLETVKSDRNRAYADLETVKSEVDTELERLNILKAGISELLEKRNALANVIESKKREMGFAWKQNTRKYVDDTMNTVNRIHKHLDNTNTNRQKSHNRHSPER